MRPRLRSHVPGQPAGPGVLRTRGALFLGVVAALIGLVFAQYSGVFASGVRVSTATSDTGDALVVGSDVKMRGVVVGRVDAINREVGRPGAVIELLIDAGRADTIPAGVTARILPANVFGQNFVELLPPAGGEAGGPIRSGAMVPADRSAETLELNDVFAKLYRVLTAVQPAKLSVALGALAEALQDNGDTLNSVIGRSDRYLRDLAPSLPDLSADIEGFARFAEQVSREAPRLFASVEDLMVLTRMLIARQGQFIELLSGGLGLTKNAKELLEANEANLIKVSKQSADIFGALGKHPRAFGDGFVDLGKFLGSLSQTDTGRQQLDAKIDQAPLPTYGPADCPRYPGLDGPNCPAQTAPATGEGAAAEFAAGLPMVYGGIGPVGSVTDKLLLGQVLLALDRTRNARFGDVGMLLAGSVLRGTTVLIPDGASGGTR